MVKECTIVHSGPAINPITPTGSSEGPLMLLKIPLRFWHLLWFGAMLKIFNYIPQSVPLMNHSNVLLSIMPNFPI